jgi:hypothetical protein
MNVRFQKNSITREVKIGFSWTMFFFGGLPLIARGMWKHVLLFLLLYFPTCGLSYFWYACYANRLTARHLAEQGWATGDNTPAAWGIRATLPGA